MFIKRFVVHMLEALCAILDCLPYVARDEDGWYFSRNQLGCLWGVAYLAVRLDERWKTGVWQ